MRTRHARPGSPIAGLCLILASVCAAAGTPESADFPPVEQASFHQQVFADEDFSILNNRYPPGGDSGFHAHVLDMFYVVIQPGRSRTQALGKEAVLGPQPAVGAAGFGDLGGVRRVHRVVNDDAGFAHFIVVQLRRGAPTCTSVSSRNAEEYVPLVDNPRLRAWRLVLEPGQFASSVTQIGRGVRVVVRGGLLTTALPDAPEQVQAIKPGDFSVQPSGYVRALANHGSETIALVEMELK